MNLVLLGLAIIGGGAVLSVLGLALSVRVYRREGLQQHREVSGYILGAGGSVYAVLLALVVVAAGDEVRGARRMVEQEAAGLRAARRLAENLPGGAGGPIVEAIRRYALTVVGEEWPAMARERSSPAAGAALQDLWRLATRIPVSSGRDQVLLDRLLARVEAASEARSMRLLAARESLHPLIWFVLVAGAVLVVGLGYFLRLPDLRTHALLCAVLAVIISLNLFLIVAMDNPFASELRVSSRAFEVLLE